MPKPKPKPKAMPMPKPIFNTKQSQMPTPIRMLHHRGARGDSPPTNPRSQNHQPAYFFLRPFPNFTIFYNYYILVLWCEIQILLKLYQVLLSTRWSGGFRDWNGINGQTYVLSKFSPMCSHNTIILITLTKLILKIWSRISHFGRWINGEKGKPFQ